MVVRRLGRHVIRGTVDAPLVRRRSVALTICLRVVGVVVWVVEVGVAAVGIVLLAMRLRLRSRRRRRRLGGGLLRLRLRRRVRRGVAAALGVGRYAAESRLVVQRTNTALGVLAQVIGLRRVRVAAERALGLGLLGSARARALLLLLLLLLALAELLLLAVLLAIVVVGETAGMIRSVE